MEVFQIMQTTYLHPSTHVYDKILVIDRDPTGPLKEMVTRISRPKLSPFQTVDRQMYCSCINAFTSLKCRGNLMTINELPQLLSYLLSNGYIIDTALSKLIGNSTMESGDRSVAFISYRN